MAATTGMSDYSLEQGESSVKPPEAAIALESAAPPSAGEYVCFHEGDPFQDESLRK
jgi:hypothetical protein